MPPKHAYGLCGTLQNCLPKRPGSSESGRADVWRTRCSWPTIYKTNLLRPGHLGSYTTVGQSKGNALHWMTIPPHGRQGSKGRGVRRTVGCSLPSSAHYSLLIPFSFPAILLIRLYFIFILYLFHFYAYNFLKNLIDKDGHKEL